MTNEECKKTLRLMKFMLPNEYYNEFTEEALDIAIKALEQEPCEDCISRQEVINRIEVRREITCESDPYNYEEWTKGYEEGIDDAIAMINSVPSVTPQRPKGKWIPIHPLQEDDDGAYLCSNCRRGNWDCDITYKYCPYCGAQMEVE